MQAGREDNLEARYGIKFCVKLGKNASETHERIKAAYGEDCMSRVFRWHKRFKEGREEVRDDERCGRDSSVRKSDLVDQIGESLEEDRRTSLETIASDFGVSKGTVYKIVHEDLNMRKVCAKFVPRHLSEEQKTKRINDSKAMINLINSNRGVLESIITCDETWIYCYDPETKRESAEWKHADSPRPKKARRSRSTGKLMLITFFDIKGMIYVHWVPKGQTVNKEYYVEVLKRVQEKASSKEAGSVQVGPVAPAPRQRAMPQVQHRDQPPEQDGHQDCSSPSLQPRSRHHATFGCVSKAERRASRSPFPGPKGDDGGCDGHPEHVYSGGLQRRPSTKWLERLH